MEKFAVLSILAVSFFATISAQIIVPGKCQNVTVEQNFDTPAYLGRWYEYQRYFTFFQPDGKCVSATYTNINGTFFEIRNYLVNANTSEVEIILGYGYQSSDTDEGTLLINFPTTGQEDGDYWILGTDYSSYSVVWSCSNVGGQSLQLAWLLTRERVPSNETLSAAQVIIDANGLKGNFLLTDQTNCPLDP
ncbi:apolipoprotein D-like [Neocloeon triangulifer]|uniref:apolipoprotein D-like n=1 Tax=Neocloeon triangulifer TaxID=2078957 RepID=UPI00286F87B7|nr:apolipoprotein D-like [Neocloeon triangulifer]